MPDINPAELSRPSISLSTPVLSAKHLNNSTATFAKIPKTSQIIPQRLDIQSRYTALRIALSTEQWTTYKEALGEFFNGRLNQIELSERIDPIIISQTGEKEHLHNQLLATIYANVTREMPDQGLAPWVSANDKPMTGAGSKPVTGDAAERRLKGEVMQLPGRDRRRIKELVHNDLNPYDSFASVLTEHHRAKVPRPITEAPSSTGVLNGMNLDSEIRKKLTQPLAIETGEFPDPSSIEGRMLPCCYEIGLIGGHSTDAASYLSFATESFIKEMLSNIFSRTRSNGPGDSGSAGFGSGASWIQTARYKRQLARDEDAFTRGEVQRDKGGLLPIESKAAGERGPLCMADLQLALELGDPSMSQFPAVTNGLINAYREGELEDWNDYTSVADHTRSKLGLVREVRIYQDTGTSNGLPNGTHHGNEMDIDVDEWGWDGDGEQGISLMDNVLDSCLAVG